MSAENDQPTVAPILDDRRQRVEALFGLLSSLEVPHRDDLPDVCREAAGAIDGDALAAHAAALAHPRHAVADAAACRAAGEYAAEQLRATGLPVLEVPATVDGVTHQSYVLTVPAAEADPRAVVLVAHYDSVKGTPGADDNASGVAAALEIARVLPRGQLPMDLIIAIVPFEEDGGNFAGARAVAEVLRVDGRQVAGAVSAEMLGFATDTPRVAGDRGDDLLLVGFPGSGDVVGTLLAAANAVHPGSMRGLALPQVLPEVGRSDHAAFHDHGWPAVMATDGAEFRNPNYHQPSDTPDTIDAAFHLRSTQALAAGLVALTLR